MKIDRLITIFKDDVLGTNNRFMAGAWLVCVTLLVLLGFYLSSESRSFLGVADSRERQISFEYPVSIKEIHVLAGQTVRAGDLLMELDQADLNEKIRLVRTQLSRLQSEITIRSQLNMIVSNSTTSDLVDPMLVDMEDLSEQLESLEEQRKNLYIFAPFAGVVGSVTFRRGEKVPAFTSVITISPDSPTYVEGFLHESLRTKVEIGRKVTVVPLSSDTQALEGKVVSVGSRIILIPPRLAAYPNMQVYGREVVVEIPPHNGLLLGEKVQIKPPTFNISFTQATAASGRPGLKTEEETLSEVKTFEIPSQIAKRYAFEPSGAIYLDDIKKFLIVSDDTDKEKSPALFLSTADGQVQEPVLRVPDIQKISDLESISQDDDYIYIMTSQGVNKKNEDKKSRNQFVRFKRQQLTFSDVSAVEFKPLLVQALLGSDDEMLNSVAGALKNQIEIEGHSVVGTELFLGFKGPLLKGKAFILKVSDFASVFTDGSLKSEQLSVAWILEFPDVEGKPHRLSDLIFADGKMYATTVCDDETCGAVWHLKEADKSLVPTLIKFYQGLKPEGLALDSTQKELFVTFDEKSSPAKFSRIELK